MAAQKNCKTAHAFVRQAVLMPQHLLTSLCRSSATDETSRIYAHRCKAPGQGATALLCGNTTRSDLLARPLSRRRGFRFYHLWRYSHGSIGGPQTLEQIAYQSAQPQILRHQFLHLPHGRDIESAEPATPAVEGSLGDTGGFADLRDRNAGTGLAKQMQNFVFRKSGTPHWMLRL
jgi:hypothetical protein